MQADLLKEIGVDACQIKGRKDDDWEPENEYVASLPMLGSQRLL